VLSAPAAAAGSATFSHIGGWRAPERNALWGKGQRAEARGVPPAAVATAWVLQLKPVTAPIVGATKLSHVEDAVKAVDVVLTADEVAELEKPYPPREVAGFQPPSIR
jgi:aryl-alcohol dehydrogenase-like predicted oxidoreductase